jgi:hypothetical protein
VASAMKYCFAKYPGRFTKCSCLHNLRTECCFDSLAARIGEFFCLMFVFCIIATNLVLLLFYFLLVNFADQPLGIWQTMLKERIRPAAIKKQECKSRYILRRINNAIIIIKSILLLPIG